MKVQVRYFASLREALGVGEWAEVGPRATVGELRAALAARGGRHAELLAGGRAVRSALNHQICGDAAALCDGAEVAFFPPVTGG